MANELTAPMTQIKSGSTPTLGGAMNYDFNQQIPGIGEGLAQYGIDTGISTDTGSFLDNMLGESAFGRGGFMSALPGVALGAFSAYDQNKTNKINRKLGKQKLAFNEENQGNYRDFREAVGGSGPSALSWAGSNVG